MSKHHEAMWNVAKGRELYDQGVPWVDIAARLSIHKLALRSYARRHGWPARGPEPEELQHSRHMPREAQARRLKKGESTLAPLASLESDH